MQPIVYKIRLDAGKPGSQASVCVKQGDINSRQLSIYLYNNSVPFKIPNGATVVLQAIKPDETVIFNDCDISGNIITHTMSQQMLTVEGTVSCELVVYGANSEVLFSPGFDVYVEAGNSNRIEDPATSSSEFTGLTEAMRMATDLTAKWSNPEVEVTVGETPSGKVEFGEDSVNFTLTIPNSGGGGGTPGGPGAVFTPHVSEDGTISWTNNGGLPNPEPQNIKGEPGSDFKIKGYYSSIDELNIGVPAPEPGDAYGIGEGYPYDIYVFDGVSFDWVNNGSIQGPPGEDGNAATIRIGTVTTGEPGSEAQANNSGTENDAVIDFVIPRGDPGPGVPEGGTTGQYLRKSSEADYSAEWADVVSGSNPNLLDNWHFASPINQRGQTEYASNVLANTVDRWGIVPLVSNTDEAQITIGGGITLSNVNDYSFFVQRLEDATFQSLRGREVTLSVIADGVLQTASAIIPVAAATSNKTIINQSIPNGAIQISEQYTASGTYLRVHLRADPGKSVLFAAAKLELGNKQTLARQDADGNWVLIDPPPDPALELMKCQRFFERIKPEGESAGKLQLGWSGTSTSAIDCTLQYSTKRIVPTFSISHKDALLVTKAAYGGGVNSTEVTAAYQSKNSLSLAIYATVEAGTAYRVYLKPGEYIDISAEL